VELDEFHVHQLGSRFVRHGRPVAGALPGVGRDAVHPPPAAGRQDDGPGAKDDEPPVVAVVAERPHDAVAVAQQPGQREFHPHPRAGVDEPVLQGADELQPGSVADVAEPLVRVRAECPLVDGPLRRAVEQPAPSLQFEYAVDHLFREELDHPPVVDHLAAPHGVGEVDLPGVAAVDISERRRDAAFGHHGMRFSQQRLAEDVDRAAGFGGRDRGPHAGAPCADDEHVARYDLGLGHQKPKCGSVSTPCCSSRM